MKIDRLTTKTREALMEAVTAATERGNPELVPEHLLLALLRQDDGITRPILEKANADANAVRGAAERSVAALPTVQGASAEPSMSRRIRDVLTKAWKATQELQDEYTSAEHILLAILPARLWALQAISMVTGSWISSWALMEMIQGRPTVALCTCCS